MLARDINLTELLNRQKAYVQSRSVQRGRVRDDSKAEIDLRLTVAVSRVVIAHDAEEVGLARYRHPIIRWYR